MERSTLRSAARSLVALVTLATLNGCTDEKIVYRDKPLFDQRAHHHFDFTEHGHIQRLQRDLLFGDIAFFRRVDRVFSKSGG